MNLELAQRVLECVESIPPGRVMSYGDVAEYVGANTPRIVGRVLSDDGGTVPWHRVLKSDGTFAHHLRDEQRQRLIAEGVRVNNGKVDLQVYRWDGKSSARHDGKSS
ncbi:MAG TPA: MGMT family protein [Jatrophihabitantaceae bacterium]